MKRFIFLLCFTLLIACGSSDAAVLVQSTSGAYTTKADIYAANTAADTAGKRIKWTGNITLTANFTAATDRQLDLRDCLISGAYTLDLAGVDVLLPEGKQIFASNVNVVGLKSPIDAELWGSSLIRVDNQIPIQKAINSLALTGGVVNIKSYPTNAEILMDKPGVELHGLGVGTTWDGLENAASALISSSPTGAVVRISAENCGLTNIAIDSSGDRLTAPVEATATAYNAGIRVEAPDVAPPEGDVMTTTLKNVYVRRQPNDGIILVGRIYQSEINSVFTTENKRHGFVIDAGNRTGRTNVQPPGVVTLTNVYAYKNEGHGLAFGNPDDDGATLLSSVRIVAINCESNRNNVTAGVSYAPYDAYIRGDNHVFTSCAFGGKNASDVLNDHGGVAVGGRDNRFINCRYLDNTRPARVLTTTGMTTTGIVFDGMSIRNPLETEAVTVDSGAVKTRVKITDTTGGLTAALDGIIDTHDGTEYEFSGVKYTHATTRSSDFSSARSKTIADDAVATLEFSDTTYGILAIGAPTEFAGPSVYAFRVGGSPYCVLLAGDAARNTASTGVLAGTTGTDSRLNVSTHTDNKIYIENRTAGSREYEFTLLSVNGGRLLAGQ